MAKKKITLDEFLGCFHSTGKGLPVEFFRKFKGINTSYREPTEREFEDYALDLLKKVQSPVLMRTRQENRAAFEDGWRDNLERIKRSGVSFRNLKQGYFRGSKYFRYKNRLIIPDNHDLEYDLFTLSRHIIFNTYLASYARIYELGCGSCQNLFMLRRLFPDKELIGLDFTRTSVQIAAYVSVHSKFSFQAHRFDMFNPNEKPGLKIEEGSAVFSIHALEQLGRNHGRITDFLLKTYPGIVVNYEPILELYDGDNLLDRLAIMYSRHRDYLSGYLTRLHLLEKQDKIIILREFRPYVGGVIHESSLVAWQVKR